MIELYVSGQNVKLYTPVIAADSLHYLTGKVHFLGSEWEGFSRWVHFRRGTGADALVYDVSLDEEDEIRASCELNLPAGEWEVYLTGSRGRARLTTVPVMLTVKESGLVDAPLHVLPLSVAEQVDGKATAALQYAMELAAQAEKGDFNGRDGQSFVIGGFFDTFEELCAEIAEPEEGAAYGVGTAAPYDIYIWDALHGSWRNNGPLQGGKGDRGEAGAVFVPRLDESGNLSWSNTAGLENPPLQNIRGPRGEKGETGQAGLNAYTSAAAAGYTGTEATFNAALAVLPYHNARHLPNGADPILVQTGNLAGASVTSQKLAPGAVTAEKLASGALRSPVEAVTGSRALSSSDAGKTLLLGEGGESAVLTLGREVSAALPVGTEIAFLCATLGTSPWLELGFGSLRVRASLDGGMAVSGALRLTDCGLGVIKKLRADEENGDLWWAAGNWEVRA